MIWTLNAKARSMMLDANVPIVFWPEAIRTACYLHRRSPTSSLTDNRSPYEALYGTTPKIGHLRRFGCRAYKHIPPAQRTEKKFGNCSSMCMMLGYVHNTTKIWRIWDFKSGRIGRAVECSNVVFDEEENAHTEEQTETIEFPDNADESQDEIKEANVNEISEPGPTTCQESKSRNLVSPSVNCRKPAKFGQKPVDLDRCLLVWAEACRFGQKPVVLGRSLPGWGEACRVGQKPAGLGRCLLNESTDEC